MGESRQQEKSSLTRPVLRLASASPRRRQLLELIGVPHVVTPSDIDETLLPGEEGGIYVCRLAMEKAGVVRKLYPDLPVLAADTTVVVDGAILEKPKDEADCLRMLSLLSGRTHYVFTGVCVISDAFPSVGCTRTEVEFRVISRLEMSAYWTSGEPQGKAGAYAIQGLGAIFVSKVTGSYSGVMGLPLFETAESLRNHGVPVWNGALKRGD